MKNSDIIKRFPGMIGDEPCFTGGLCPACGGQKICLVVNSDRRRELYCLEGCAADEIIKKTGLTAADLLEEVPPLPWDEPSKVHADVELPVPKQEEKWPKPIPLDNERKLPSFPVECLPPVARDYALAIADAVQVSVDMAAVATLPIVALCAQKVFRIEGKPDWLEPLNLYCMVVAPPAERKSAVAELMTRPILKYEKHANELLQFEIDYYEAERAVIAQEIKKAEAKALKGQATVQEIADRRHNLSTLKEVRPLRLWTDDTTPEAAISLMAGNSGRTAIISAEGGIFDIMAGKYSGGSVDVGVFLKAHAGDSIRVDRKGRPSEYVNKAAMTMLLFAQPVVLDGVMGNDTLRGCGLTARLLYSIPLSKVGQRTFETKAIPRDIETAFEQMITELLQVDMPETEMIIHLSTDAYRLLAEFFRELEPRLKDDLEPIGDWAGKLHGTTLRIAGVLHCMECRSKAAEMSVSAQMMESAISIGRYFLEHALAAHRLMGADKQVVDARYVLLQLKKSKQSQITRTELNRLCHGRFAKADDMNPAVELLIEYGYIREEVMPIGYNSRKQIIYKLNPNVSGINGIVGIHEVDCTF